ncbi:MAG: cyclic nucleotide-binding domain-containing protein [Myxococcota bacterium]
MKLVEAMTEATSPDANLQSLWEHFPGQALRGRRHQTLLHASDPSDAVYLLLSGEARCSVDGRFGGRTTLLLRAPALVGDRDILAHTHARENVDLLTASELVLWPREQFVEEWTQDERLRTWLFQDITTRYANSLAFAELAAAPAEARVHAVIATLNNKTIELDYLARACGVAEKTASRALSSFTQEERTEETLRLWHSLAAEPDSR